MERTWSQAILESQVRLDSDLAGKNTSKGYTLTTFDEVIGTMDTLFDPLFAWSLEIITPGLVFAISVPIVGSKTTR
jgi:hypothetical protein